MSNDEVAAARAAIADGDFAQARHHINNLAMDGSHAREVEELRGLIAMQESTTAEVTVQRIGWAIAVSVLGYIILSFRTPAAWGPVVWGLVAFLALPLLTGVLAGNSVGSNTSSSITSARFWRGFSITASTVVAYTLVGMALTRSKMHSSDKSSDLFIFFLVAAVYGVCAGLISGIASNLFARSGRTS